MTLSTILVDQHTRQDAEEKLESAKSKVRKEDVWRELLKSAYGRDKAFVRDACEVLFSLHVLKPDSS